MARILHSCNAKATKRRGGTSKKHKTKKERKPTINVAVAVADENRPSNTIHQARIDNNPNWGSIVNLNENPDLAKKLRQNEWDFSHLRGILETLAGQHPKSLFFLIGTSPFIYGATGKELCPTLGILIAPEGETPPQFVQVINPEDATEAIISFSEFGLAWNSFGRREFGDRVFALRQLHGTIDPKKIGRAKLWNLMKDALKRKVNGELDIQKANFEFQKPNGKWIREPYVKKMSQYSNICKMHDLVQKDDRDGPKLDDESNDILVDPRLMSQLKQAIKTGFDAARSEREEQITMLKHHHPSFAAIQCVKVFPRNKAILESFQNRTETAKSNARNTFFKCPPPTAGNDNIGYINESYGTAMQIYPDPNLLH